jgi:YggT family protein
MLPEIAFSFLKVLRLLLDFYKWSLIIYSVMSWLVLFNIVNNRNQFIYLLNNFLRRLLEPILHPIRSVIPVAGGLDLSAMVLFLIIYFLQEIIGRTMHHILLSGYIL